MVKAVREPSIEHLADICHQHYVIGLSQTDIASTLDVDQATVGRWLKKARDRGVVAFSIDKSFAISGTEETPWSSRLRDAFELRECAVVRVDRSSLQSILRPDDILHTGIASYTGMRARETIVSGDHLAVAGGRSVYRFAQYIKRNPPSKIDIRITPLSGRIWTGCWQPSGQDILERPLDADDSAFVLAVAFESERGTRVSQINYPLYAESPAAARKIMRDHCAALPDRGWNWKLKPPSRAFVGVGVLHPHSRHRISVFLQAFRGSLARQKDRPYLSRAADDLNLAVKLVKKNRLPAFADVANRLYPALPLPSELSRERLPELTRAYKELNRALSILNNRAVVMHWDHLRDIPTVRVIAGGELKLQAIWTVLLVGLLGKTKHRIVTELSTDVDTAKALVNACEFLRRTANPEVKNWYHEIIEGTKLFRC